MGTNSKDLFLTSEERYDIWEVKSEERPHLLIPDPNKTKTSNDDNDNEGFNDTENDFNSTEESFDSNDNTKSDEEKMETIDQVSSSPTPPPLVDGCDLEGWRQEQLVHVSSFQQGYLNVGTGCSLLRRESQLPILSSKATAKWKALQERFMTPPTAETTPMEIPEEESIKLSWYPFFEKQNIPVVLQGLTKSWKAMETCQWKQLNEEYGHFEWRFSDTHGACMMLSTYTKYVQSLEGQCDDAPLAVYDSQLDGDDRVELLDHYQVPECFAAPDLFEGLGMEERPPFRWILMGPERSGTGLHIDPMGTHAWVTVVEGLKRWVLFPYGTDPSDIGIQSPQIPSVIWFSEWYDKAMAKVPGAIEVLQRPGETVYVPAGWPHLVLNLEPTVAITQNYATEYPTFERIEQSVLTEEPEFHEKWLDILQNERPEIFDKISSSSSSSTTNLSDKSGENPPTSFLEEHKDDTNHPSNTAVST